MIEATSPIPVELDVVVPSAYRPDDLARCLKALGGQTLAPNRVVVVLREDDQAAAQVVEDVGSRFPSLALDVVHPAKVGVIPALEAGIKRTSSLWIAVLDDDAVPPPGWIDGLTRHISTRPDIQGVGGRIANYPDGVLDARPLRDGPVARLDWVGRVRSQLHAIPSERVLTDAVDFLPGSNMCFRREHLTEIDPRLATEGMTPFFELYLTLRATSSGPVLFDSDLVVEHFPAPRPSGVYTRADARAYEQESEFFRAYISVRYCKPAMAPTILTGLMVSGIVMAARAKSRWSGRARVHGSLTGIVSRLLRRAQPLRHR